VRILILTLLGLLFRGLEADAAEMSRAQIIAEGEKTADAQLAALKEGARIDWIGAVMYAGIAEFSPLSAKGAAYRNAVLEMGARVTWTPLMQRGNPFNADDFCIGQAFMDAADFEQDPSLLAPLRQRADALADHLNANAGDPVKLTWSWCDALFMAPPVLARLSMVTGDRRYRDAMDAEWWKTAARLYDPDEHLFYRDSRFVSGKRMTRNGRKVFWSRGNGWVAAGLARVLTYLPEDDPARRRYLGIYREMIARLATLQRPDGTWSPSLLDPAEFPCSEFSGTALDCYAVAWGVNHGFLDRQTYLPVAARAWAGLLAARRPDSLPGYVQDLGFAPGYVQRTGARPYATGAFLMAASELAALAAAAPLQVPAVQAPTEFPRPVLTVPKM
jgi:rhamnogalacturonyl hydrolase YesR